MIRKMMFITALLVYFFSPVRAVTAPDAAIIQVHDLQMINQQRFRYEELNDYNDVETEKARYKKKHEQPDGTSLINRLFKKKKFVEKDGEIKIEADENSD